MFRRSGSRADIANRQGLHGDEPLPQTGEQAFPTARPAPLTDLVIVIVSWNVWDHLRACLTSIELQSQAIDEPHRHAGADLASVRTEMSAPRRAGAPPKRPRRENVAPNSGAHYTAYVRRFGPRSQATLQVVVFDNASDDATPSLLTSRFPWVQAIFSQKNVGFSGGNNRTLEAMGFDTPTPGRAQAETLNRPSPAASARRPRSAPARFVFFLNPDTELLPGSLWALYHGIEEDETIGAIGPQLRYADGALQSSRRRFPGPLTGFFESTWLEQTWPQNPWTRRYHLADWPADCRQDVDWLVGAALLARGDVLAVVGGFDPQFFMYSEETDLCRRLKLAGWRVVYDPAAIVIHSEGRSSTQVSARRHILFNRSKVRYARKWHGPVWAALLRRYLLAEFRLQIVSEWLKALLGHKRALRRARLSAYRAVLKSNLE